MSVASFAVVTDSSVVPAHRCLSSFCYKPAFTGQGVMILAEVGEGRVLASAMPRIWQSSSSGLELSSRAQAAGVQPYFCVK